MNDHVTKLFGTDGIRGEAGAWPLDAATLRAVGRALGRVLAEDLHHPARIAIGRDTRESGPWILAELAAGLAEEGARVRSAGVIPTPGISFLARSDDFDAGIVVSASHNPYHDNGLKVFSRAGTKLADALESRVEGMVARAPAISAADLPVPPVPEDEPALRGSYAAFLLERGRAAGGLDGLSVVVDCAHGASCGLAVPVLAGLGARVSSIHERPDGRNINEDSGSLHLRALAAAVIAAGADAGVAFDGDADRALFVDAVGQPVDGDQVLLLAADVLLEAGRLRGGGVVGTVMSNFGLERALVARGLSLVREKVGDRNVLERMQSDGFNLGGEQSGHVIFLDEAPTGDGLLTAIQVLAAVRASGRTLQELAGRLERSPQVLRNVRVRERVPLDGLPSHCRIVDEWTRRLGAEGRIVVRYSGTERLVRVMAEGTDGASIAECVDAIADDLARQIGADAPIAAGATEPGAP